VRQAVESAIDKLKSLGCEVVPVSLPHTAYAIPTYYLIATAEASSNLARYDGVRYGYRAAGVTSLSEMYRRSRDEGFGAEVKRRIMLGTYALSAGYYDACYLKAQKVRALLTRDF
jgi:aspartyl-tRNA(Asn)/glutamyl-tRNA(Gln) amidotransferase subunit A